MVKNNTSMFKINDMKWVSVVFFISYICLHTLIVSSAPPFPDVALVEI